MITKNVPVFEFMGYWLAARGTELLRCLNKRDVMKQLIIIAFIPLLLQGISALGQSPAPESDTIPTPAKQGDPAIKALPPRLDYIQDKRRITSEEIPQLVRQTLESEVKYKGWQKAAIFYDENKNEYIVEFNKDDNMTSYRFNKDGAAIIEE